MKDKRTKSFYLLNIVDRWSEIVGAMSKGAVRTVLHAESSETKKKRILEELRINLEKKVLKYISILARE